MASTARTGKQVLVLVGWATSSRKKDLNNWSSWKSSFLSVFLCHNKELPSPYGPQIHLPHLSLGTVNPDLCIPSIPSLHSHPSPLSPYGKLQGPRRDHRRATRRQDPRNCQTQGGLSVREDQSLCKPLRHSTPPTGTLCLQPFCLAWKGDVGEKKKEGKGGVEGKKHLCEMM